jgi:hypothetical protein
VLKDNITMYLLGTAWCRDPASSHITNFAAHTCCQSEGPGKQRRKNRVSDTDAGCHKDGAHSTPGVAWCVKQIGQIAGGGLGGGAQPPRRKQGGLGGHTPPQKIGHTNWGKNHMGSGSQLTTNQDSVENKSIKIWFESRLKDQKSSHNERRVGVEQQIWPRAWQQNVAVRGQTTTDR